MKLTVLDIDKFVAVNELKPVATPSFFEPDGSPAEGGLFSASLFGRPGSEERRKRWAYIDLGGTFLHPLIYRALCQLDRKFPDVVMGIRQMKLTKSGELREAGEGDEGWSGIDALYKHWESIAWHAGADSGNQRRERIGLLRAVPRRLAFVTKWPVMPAVFRDVDTSGGGRIKDVPPINGLYVQLMTSAPSTSSGLVFADGARKRRAQETLLEIHRSSLELLAGKKGLIQERVLGKYTDWTVRGVLSGPALAKAPSPDDQEVPFGYLGVPLYLVINMFQPFVVKRLEEIFRPIATGDAPIRLRGKDGAVGEFDFPADARSKLGAELYKKWISRFMRSQDSRLERLQIETAKGKLLDVPLYDAALGRQTTLLDLFFIVASEVVADKHIMFTRYPVEDFRACHFAKPAILTTERVVTRQIGDRVFSRYPDVTAPVRWVDSFRLNNSYTKAMGADFDGDTHRVVGIFTQEANAEAARLIEQPTNYCDGQGSFGRPVANEAVLTLFSLTQ